MQPNILVHSPPGHGKTVLIGSAAGDKRMMPMLLLDFEGGTMSIDSKVHVVKDLDELPDKKTLASKIVTLRIKKIEDFTEAYNWLVDNPEVFKMVCIDSLSEVNYQTLTEAVEYSKRQNPKHNGVSPELQDYGRSSTQMRKLMRAFRDLECSTVFTTHCKEERDPRSQQMQTRPNLVGKLPNELPGMMDIMGYLALDSDTNDAGDEIITRVLIVQPSPTMMAKDRSENGKLGDEILNPTLPGIFDLLEA